MLWKRKAERFNYNHVKERPKGQNDGKEKVPGMKMKFLAPLTTKKPQAGAKFLEKNQF